MAGKAGMFVAFEGTDGAGKAVIARRVAEALSLNYPNVVFLQKTHPPTESGYAAYHFAKLREVLWEYEPAAPVAAMGDRHWLALIASWFHALEHYSLRPLIDKGSIVIADSWYYKYLARFLLKPDTIAAESRTVFAGLRRPDLVILLDVDPKIAEWRKPVLTDSEKGKLEYAGDGIPGGFVEYQSRVRETLLDLKDETWKVINTNQISVQTVVDRVASTTASVLQSQRLRTL